MTSQYERVLALEEKLLEILGVDGLLSALTKALSLDELEENFEYICRMEDIEIEYD